MKAFFTKVALLITAIVLVNQGIVSAQNLAPDYTYEVGINGGKSISTIPTGVMDTYTGSQTKWTPDFSVRFNYLISPHWQLGADFGERRWMSTGYWSIYDKYNQFLGIKKITFLVADPAYNFSAQFNRVIPFYTPHFEYNKANIYFGVMLGIVATVNDGSTHYGIKDNPPQPNYQYLSQYNYNPGLGYSYGVQAGYTYYVFRRLGVNGEVAWRYVQIGTDDEKYGHANANYHLSYFPITLGIRYRF